MTSYEKEFVGKSFAEVLRIRRKAMQLTQEELAEKFDISTRMLANYELGKNLPRIDRITYFAYILQVSVNTLIESLLEY
jgi:transcriptional regulator with XRE-family HTH domain